MNDKEREAANRKIAEEFCAVQSNGDVDAFVDMFHPDATFRCMIKEGAIPGIGAPFGVEQPIADYGDHVRNIAKSVDIHYDLLRYAVDGDIIAIEAKGNSRMPNGEYYRNDYVFILEMRDGKIAKGREYFDSILAKEAVEAAVNG